MDTAAARKVHDELLASKPEGASHNADICPFCVDKATEDTSTVPDPSRSSGGPDVSENQPVPNEHGGRDTHPMSDMTKETHEALLAKAVADATSTLEKALADKAEEAKSLAAQNEELAAEKAKLEADNARLNNELDTAQVGLKTAQDEVAQLKTEIAARDEASAKAEIASKRAEQVKNLKLYDDEYVNERAAAWADLADDEWAARLDEWAKIRPASTEAPSTDSASAMSGTSGDLTKEPVSTDTAGDQSKKPSARRAVLGLS